MFLVVGYANYLFIIHSIIICLPNIYPQDSLWYLDGYRPI